jgi:hypothetical protein
MTSNISKKIFLPFVLLLLLACAYNNSGGRKYNTNISGSFFAYHTALGAGRGMIFRIPIAASMMEQYAADSFYLGGKPQAFSIRTIRDTMYLESTYFVSARMPTVGEAADQHKNFSQIITNDAILTKRQFYPSWIIFSGKKGVKRIDILNYKEIFAQAKL